MDEIIKRDQNFVTVLAGVTNDSDQDIIMLRVDPITKRLLVSATGGGGGGTVTTVTSNDGSITVTNPTTTPDLAVVSAPKLTTARTIGGTSFDGTANIKIGALNSTNINATTSAELAGVISDETGSGALVFAASPAFTGTPTAPTQAPFDNSTKLATTEYVDAAFASFDTKPAVAYASTSALPANTYANGTLGVGATLTGNVNGPLIIDGVTLTVGQAGEYVLVAGEATQANNGWYVITQVGVVAVSKYILTRLADSDQAAEIGSGYITSVIAPNGVVPGSANNGKVFISVAAADPFVVGTTALTFSPVGSVYSAGNGLGLSGTTFSIDTNITVDKTTAQALSNKTLTTPVINGLPTGTGVDSAATASTLVSRDANANINVNNALQGYTTTATAGGTTTLTVASTYQQYFTGTLNQTITMPVTSTLVLGQSFIIYNNSTGVLTINSSGGNLIVTLAAGTKATVTCILTSGTTAASWSTTYEIQNIQQSLYFGGLMINPIMKRVFGSNLSTGDTDLYTVPTGRRAFIGNLQFHNPSAGTIGFYMEIKVSGTYYRISSVSSANAGLSNNNFNAGGIYLEAGESLSINTTTTAGLNASIAVVEMDATSPVKSAKLTGASTGHNTLYTCPAGKSAYVTGQGSGMGMGMGNPNVFAGLLNFVSDGGGTRAVTTYLVPSGGSAGTTNQMMASANVSANVRSSALIFNATLGVGDFVDFNVDTGAATQLAWVNIIEI